MGIFNRFNKQTKTVSDSYKMIVDVGNGFYSFGNDLYKSDIVRSAIRPKVRAIGKALPKHIRETDGVQSINPDLYMKRLLEYPNAIMCWQQLAEKLATQLELNNNAFALVVRDENDVPYEIYPIVSHDVQAEVNKTTNELYLKFQMKDGKYYTFKYSDVIHLRKDFNSNEIFGDSPVSSLLPLMEVVNTTDQGIIQAIKSSGVIRWLLKFQSVTRPEQIKERTKEFVKQFMSTEEESEFTGAAGVDQSTDAKQVEPKNYVPNAAQMQDTTKRIRAFFNTNEKIVTASYNENEWISYHETAIEPDLIQLAKEMTRKLFSDRMRGFGNRITLESNDLSFTSTKTKLNLVQLVDRELMSVEEFRDIFGLGPKNPSHTFMRRLDTAKADEIGGKEGMDED